MKKLFGINIKHVFLSLGLLIVVFLAQCGLEALLISVPPSGNANEISTFILNTKTDSRIDTRDPDPTYTTKMVVGFLAPKSWNAAENTAVTFTTTDKGKGTMVLMSDAEKEKFTGLSWPEAAKKKYGIGPNLVDDMEWVVYVTTSAYTFVNNGNTDIEVTIKSKLGSENMLVKLGFFLGATKEGVDDDRFHKIAFSDNFEVKNGTGDLIDFVNPQLGKVDPVKSLDNDIITLTFDAGVTETDLSNTDDIYLCAKAILDNGDVTEVCEQTDKTRLKPIGGKKFIIDFWPRGFFDTPKGRSIVKLEYYFKDITGNGKVGYGNTADPFKYTFVCK
jgi:hypothetical protein